MTFPSKGGSRPDIALAAREIRELSWRMKTQTQSMYNTTAAGPTSGTAILVYHQDLILMDEDMAVLVAVPNVEKALRDISNDQTINLETEYAALNASLDGTIQWVITNIPNDGSVNKWLRNERFEGRKLTNRIYAPSETATFRTELQKIINQID